MKRILIAFLFIIPFSSCQQIIFYLTTMTSKPVAQHINAPTTIPFEIQGKNVITILMYNRDNIYAYPGSDINNGMKYTYSSVSDFLKQKKATAGNELRVLIKAGGDGNYKSTVNILDQMTINHIKYYTLSDQSEKEKKIYQTT